MTFYNPFTVMEDLVLKKKVGPAVKATPTPSAKLPPLPQVKPPTLQIPKPPTPNPYRKNKTKLALVRAMESPKIPKYMRWPYRPILSEALVVKLLAKKAKDKFQRAVLLHKLRD